MQKIGESPKSTQNIFSFPIFIIRFSFIHFSSKVKSTQTIVKGEREESKNEKSRAERKQYLMHFSVISLFFFFTETTQNAKRRAGDREMPMKSELLFKSKLSDLTSQYALSDQVSEWKIEPKR